VASARFTDGTEIEADVIVGADGIHSAVRASLPEFVFAARYC
jgi:2-polyprenyl-6-methoxyphenol hydroxylase-like FAD-dependent oxidoreductase